MCYKVRKRKAVRKKVGGEGREKGRVQCPRVVADNGEWV
jgi:hypothetical protein